MPLPFFGELELGNPSRDDSGHYTAVGDAFVNVPSVSLLKHGCLKGYPSPASTFLPSGKTAVPSTCVPYVSGRREPPF